MKDPPVSQCWVCRSVSLNMNMILYSISAIRLNLILRTGPLTTETIATFKKQKGGLEFPKTAKNLVDNKENKEYHCSFLHI